MRENRIRKQKNEVMRCMKEYLFQLSLQIFRKYFVDKVANHMKSIFITTAIKSYKKFQAFKKRKQFIMMLKQKDGVPNFIKKVFQSRIKANHLLKDTKNKEILKRRSRGFIGKLKKLPTIKKRVLPRIKFRQETESAIPTLIKSTTIKY